MKNFIDLNEISTYHLRKILDDAKKRKKFRKNLNFLDVDKKAPLKGKLLIQMFEKSSLRTRLSFYLAIKQLGGSTLTLRPDELHLFKGGESLEDTAKILSSFGDAFMLRTDDDNKISEFKKYLSIPIINGLSPSSHPTQILSDIFTIEEIKNMPISKLNITWIGDCNNVLNSLISASVKLDFDASTNVLAIGLPADSTGDEYYDSFSAIPNNAGSGKTGDILFSTTGHSSGDTYMIILELLKRYD